MNYQIVIASYTPFLKDADDAILKKYLENEGANVKIVSWTDKDFNWKIADAVIIRSTWEYHKTIKEYINWLDYLKDSNILVFNDVEIIKNNILKDKQIKWIKDNNLPFNTCEIFSLYDDTMLKPEKTLKDTIKKYFPAYYEKSMFVIKPTISAYCTNTYLIDPFNLNKDMNAYVSKDEETLFYELLNNFNDRGIILQVYCEAIKDGEFGMPFLNGVLVQAVRKMPGKLYGKEQYIPVKKLPDAVKELGEKVVSLLPLDKILIARVDAVMINDKEARIMEIELAEPNIYLRKADGMRLDVHDPDDYLPKIAKIGCQSKYLIAFAKNIIDRITKAKIKEF